MFTVTVIWSPTWTGAFGTGAQFAGERASDICRMVLAEKAGHVMSAVLPEGIMLKAGGPNLMRKSIPGAVIAWLPKYVVP